jgi:hypothetical protein
LLVEAHGARNWSFIAQGIPNRTSKSCRLRWCNQLNPTLRRDNFTPAEERTILAVGVCPLPPPPPPPPPAAVAHTRALATARSRTLNLCHVLVNQAFALSRMQLVPPTLRRTKNSATVGRRSPSSFQAGAGESRFANLLFSRTLALPDTRRPLH